MYLRNNRYSIDGFLLIIHPLALAAVVHTAYSTLAYLMSAMVAPGMASRMSFSFGSSSIA